jgi:hypothetical protein
MVQATFERDRLAGHRQSIRLRIGSKTYDVAQENALALAHALIRGKKYNLASRICEIGLRWEAHASQATILLACCRAGQRRYDDCNRLLQAAFPDGEEDIRERVQASLVYQSQAMTHCAIVELTAAADELPDLPILWLLLGDQFAELRNHRKAALCWRLAVDRDNSHGPVAVAAHRQLTQISYP